VRDKKLEEDNKVLGRQLGQLQMTCEAQSQQITKQEREASELVCNFIALCHLANIFAETKAPTRARRVGG
jgi:hypothetical protein